MRDRRGMTLIEMLVALVVFSIIMGGSLSMLSYQSKALDRNAVDKVALDNRLEDVLTARMIPDIVRPNDGYRSGFADLEAVGLGSLHRPARTNEAEFLQPLLEIGPCLLAIFAAAAFLFF